MMSRALPLALIALLTLIGLAPGAAAQTDVADCDDTFALPGDEVFPEGIAFHEGTGDFFVGSTTSGTIFRGDVETGEVEIFAEGDEALPTAVGTAVDEDGRLYVAGGGSGEVIVYDIATGDPIQRFDNEAEEDTFINDVDVAPGGDAYLTDSFRPVLYRIPVTADEVGDLEVFLDLTETPIAYEEGFNLNGIVVTPDGEYLLAVQSNTGKLYRVDLATEDVTEVELEGEALTSGDGLLLDGQILYVVRNQLGEIVPVRLAEDFGSGVVGEPFTDPSLAFPTTIAKENGCLLVVNSQFGAQDGQPELPFTVSEVPIPERVLQEDETA